VKLLNLNDNIHAQLIRFLMENTEQQHPDRLAVFAWPPHIIPQENCKHEKEFKLHPNSRFDSNWESSQMTLPWVRFY